jgi:hypothetical protein
MPKTVIAVNGSPENLEHRHPARQASKAPPPRAPPLSSSTSMTSTTKAV